MAAPAKKVLKKAHDSHLRRVSLSTNSLLLDASFKLKPEMLELLRVLAPKYRIFLITKVPAENSPEHNEAKLAMRKIVDEELV